MTQNEITHKSLTIQQIIRAAECTDAREAFKARAETHGYAEAIAWKGESVVIEETLAALATAALRDADTAALSTDPDTIGVEEDVRRERALLGYLTGWRDDAVRRLTTTPDLGTSSGIFHQATDRAFTAALVAALGSCNRWIHGLTRDEG